jgi:hypothetical protein
LSHGHARTSPLLHLIFFFFFFFSFLRGDDVRSVRIQSGGSSISHNAIPPKVYDSRNWRISRPSSSSSSCAATSPRSAVRSRRIVERRRGVTKNKKKKMEASLTTGEAGENFLLVMIAGKREPHLTFSECSGVRSITICWLKLVREQGLWEKRNGLACA